MGKSAFPLYEENHEQLYFQAQEKNSKERYLQKLERKSGEWSSDGTCATVENVAIFFLIK